MLGHAPFSVRSVSVPLLIVLLFSFPARAQEPAVIIQARNAVENRDWPRAIRLLDTYLGADSTRMEARYLRGVAYGERGKHPTLKNQLLRYLDSAEDDFAFILARDSLYQDVLYQHALLHRYRGDLKTAIQLGEAQLHLKPSLAHARIGLLHIYWRFILENRPTEARMWLRQQKGALARLFVGKTFARQGLYRSADNIYTLLLQNSGDLSPVPVLLARARAHFSWNKPNEGTTFVHEAIDALTSRTDALILFEDIKTIVSPQESYAFDQLQDPEGYQHFFMTFWTKRDPMPAAPYNARIAEHYRRLRIAEQHYLFYGFRAWYRSPFTHTITEFAPTYSFSRDFDDRGVTFIRHGEPNDYTVGEANSWLYEDSLLIFHFAPTCIREICSVSTHFTPVPHGETWGARLVGLDFLDAEKKSSEFILRGLATDRHRWPEKTRTFELPYVIAAFRGMDHKTLVEVHYGIPLQIPVDVEVGMTLHDERWQRHGLFRETRKLETAADRDAMTTGHFQVDLVPMDYRLSLHARSLETPHLKAHTRNYRPPRFDEPGLKMSDVLLADTIVVLNKNGVSTRNDLYIQVNPAHRFRTQQPVFVYFELYGLTPSSKYTTAYTLTPSNSRGEVREAEEGAITLQTSSQEGLSSSVVEYVEIDVSDMRRGTYLLTIAVQDEHTKATSERTRTLELIR